MNAKQKKSIIQDKEYRKEIVKHIASIFNKKLPDALKIKDDRIDEFINENDMIENFKFAKEVNSEIMKGYDIVGDKSDEPSIANIPGSSRWGYLLMEKENDLASKAKNNMTKMKFFNKTTKSDLAVETAKRIINSDPKKFFVTSDREALENVKKNPLETIGGFLLTDQDILASLREENPELYKLTAGYWNLYQGNICNKVLNIYSNPMCLVYPYPKDHIFEFSMIAQSCTAEVADYIGTIMNDVVEFEPLTKLNNAMRQQKVGTISSDSQYKLLNYDEKTSKDNIIQKKLCEKGIIVPGMPFKKAFYKDNKEITYVEALKHIDPNTGDFLDGLELRDANVELMKKIERDAIVNKFKANSLFVKETINQLQTNEYYHDYNALDKAIQNLEALTDKVTSEIQNHLETNPNDLDYEKDKLSELFQSKEYQDLYQNYEKEKQSFDLERASIKEKNFDSIQKEFKIKREYRELKKLLEDINKNETVENHGALKEKLEFFVNKVDFINNQIDLAKSMDRNNGVKMAHTLYNQAYDDPEISNFREINKKQLEDYSVDHSAFTSYYGEEVRNINLDEMEDKFNYLLKTSTPEQKKIINQFRDEMSKLNELYQHKEDHPNLNRFIALEFAENEDNKKLLNAFLRISYPSDKKLTDGRNSAGIHRLEINAIENLSESFAKGAFASDFPEIEKAVLETNKKLKMVEAQAATITNPYEKDLYRYNAINEIISDGIGQQACKLVTENSKKLVDDLEKAKQEAKEFEVTKDQFDKVATGKSYSSLASKCGDLYEQMNADTSIVNFFNDKMKELDKTFGNSKQVMSLKEGFKRSLNKTAAKDAITTIALMNIKDAEYNNRGRIGRWWYRNSHKNMMKTKENMVNFLANNGLDKKDIDAIGLDDKANFGYMVYKFNKNNERLANKFEEKINTMYEKLITSPHSEMDALSKQKAALNEPKANLEKEIKDIRKEFATFYQSPENTTYQIKDFDENHYHTYRDGFKKWLEEPAQSALKEKYQDKNNALKTIDANIKAISEKYATLENTFRSGVPLEDTERSTEVQTEIKANEEKAKSNKTIDKNVASKNDVNKEMKKDGLGK